ncbi:MAG TPA: PAS domain-containing protein, partial [Rhizobiaceae bacterium]|nr:PAS domain-containing protein [Rhizobiaceae bacterium]
RSGRPAPERSEIEPSDIRSILGDTFILEVSLHFRTVSFRLAGTRLCAAHGRELKGLGFLALWSEEDNYEIARAIARVYRDMTPILLSYTAHSATGRELDYESVILPLATAADGNPRLLGIATPRSSPYWLGSDTIISNNLRNSRVIEPVAAEMAQEPVVSPRESRRFGHLTVLDGGKAGRVQERI